MGKSQEMKLILGKASGNCFSVKALGIFFFLRFGFCK